VQIVGTQVLPEAGGKKGYTVEFVGEHGDVVSVSLRSDRSFSRANALSVWPRRLRAVSRAFAPSGNVGASARRARGCASRSGGGGRRVTGAMAAIAPPSSMPIRPCRNCSSAVLTSPGGADCPAAATMPARVTAARRASAVGAPRSSGRRLASNCRVASTTCGGNPGIRAGSAPSVCSNGNWLSCRAAAWAGCASTLGKGRAGASGASGVGRASGAVARLSGRKAVVAVAAVATLPGAATIAGGIDALLAG